MPKGAATRKVLDAWAVLAWIKGAPGASNRVQRLLDDAEKGLVSVSMNMINVGEVYYILAKTVSSRDAEDFIRDFREMPVGTVPVPKTFILEAARLKARFAISYADAFAVATAVRERAPLVTGDPEIKVLAESGIVDVEWVGP